MHKAITNLPNAAVFAAVVVVLFIQLIGSAAAAGPTTHGDLYKVMVKSRAEADQLLATGISPMMRLMDGYLALIDHAALEKLAAGDLKFDLIAENLSRDELALDNRLDNLNLGRFELIYSEGALRLYRISEGEFSALPVPRGVMRLPDLEIKIDYHEPLIPSEKTARDMMDLNSLIALVSQDSLYSYTSRLQAFYRRNSGSDSNYASRDWLAAKFAAFGYDSVIIDSFLGDGYTPCQNVIAVKVGSRLPNQQIVVGAHRDGVYNSPAADDNGSGSAAVLEMARILKNIDTDLTFIFALFDAEEDGLLGSYHYVDEAMDAGDSIIYMFNMDMIAEELNSTQAKLYHGSDVTYTYLFQDLADSLMSITSYLQGNTSGSDHYPFSQVGIPVTFLHEYEFSTVYHGPRDSTTHMNFVYMTKMVKAALATVYFLGQTYHLPGIDFAFPGGLPTYVLPNQTTALNVQIVPIYGGIPVSGSGQIHYALNNNPYTAMPMTEIGSNLYQAILPAGNCYDKVKYFFSAEEQENGIFYDPDSLHPYVSIVAQSEIFSINDNFENNLGWTTQVLGASSGAWVRGVPVNDASWDYDPVSDGDGSGKCYLTENQYGNTDVDNGAVRLISPVFDMSRGGNIEYWYYLYLTNTDGSDKLLLEINSNGGLSGNWTQIANHTQNGGLEWRFHQITEEQLIAAGVALTATMQLRFTANDADAQSIVEAGVDGVKVRWYDCLEPLIVNGLIIYEDTLTLVTVAEQNVTGELQVIDGETTLLRDVWFTNDLKGLFQPDSQIYDMEIAIANPAIASATLTDDWQFTLTGGEVGGTTMTIEISHLAQAYYTSPPIPINVLPAYLCGDANNDDIADVSDAVYIVNYVFISGEPPDPYAAGDANCDGSVDVSDAVMIINYVFVGGSDPCDPSGDGVPDC